MRINSGSPNPLLTKGTTSIKSDIAEKSNKEEKPSNTQIPLKDSVKIRPTIKLDEAEFANMASEMKDPGYANKLLESTKNDILSNAQAAISAQANQNPDSLTRLLK